MTDIRHTPAARRLHPRTRPLGAGRGRLRRMGRRIRLPLGGIGRVSDPRRGLAPRHTQDLGDTDMSSVTLDIIEWNIRDGRTIEAMIGDMQYVIEAK